MNSFSQFNIKVSCRAFEGEKIKIKKIINREIVVHHFKLEDSKIFKDRGTGKCLQIQISVDGKKHVLFTGSSGLIEMIQNVPESGFPFTTTIIEDNERYSFS
jgi:hypothetical protein